MQDKGLPFHPSNNCKIFSSWVTVLSSQPPTTSSLPQIHADYELCKVTQVETKEENRCQVARIFKSPVKSEQSYNDKDVYKNGEQMHQDSGTTPRQSMLLIVHLYKRIRALAPGLVRHFMAQGRKATSGHFKTKYHKDWMQDGTDLPGFFELFFTSKFTIYQCRQPSGRKRKEKAVVQVWETL